MNLNWSGEEYEMLLASPREHQLIRDAIVEAGYVVGGLPDADRGRTARAHQGRGRRLPRGLGEFLPSRNLSVADLELIRSCFAETLEFFSDAEYQMRMNWTKGESSVAFTGLLDDRRKITIDRQWG